jgi:outer membrane protein W
MGADKAFSLAIKPGIYIPQGDLKDFDTGFNGEVAVAYKFFPNLAVEAGIGYFKTQNTISSESGPGYLLRDKSKIRVIPLTASMKGILPMDKWEFYGLGGIGEYFVKGKDGISGTIGGVNGSVSGSDTDRVFGAHLGLGVNYNITSNLFVGAEGKYLWTRHVNLSDDVSGVSITEKFRLNGILGTAVIGYRF